MNFSDIASKVVRKSRHLFNNPSEWREELRFIKRYAGIEQGIAVPLVRLGRNWDAHPEKPVMLLWKINHWKRPFILPYLDEYRVAFVRRDRSPQWVEQRHPELFSGHFELGVWGNQPGNTLVSFAREKGIALYRIEDGFLRSLGVGLLHTRPHSLVFDRTGLYYDASRPSDIQALFDTVDLNSDPALAAQAKAGLTLMRAAKLSKYYAYFSEEPHSLEAADGQEKLLVIGQVEGDASLRYGKVGGRSSQFHNADLVAEAARRFKDAKLYYRPHPDKPRRRSRSVEKAISPRPIEILPTDKPVAPLIDAADRVFTQTSLTGFEAALRGVHTVVRGAPFYAGRGLTEDLEPIPGRKRKLSPEEMFAAAYLLYPRYIHPQSDRRCSFFDVAGHFIVEQVKHLDIRHVPKHWLDLEKLREVADFLPTPARLFLYLNSRPDVASADTDAVLAIAGDEIRIEDFPQFAELLISSFNYDALQAYTNKAIDRLSSCWDSVKHDARLLRNFFETLCFVHSNQNGRITSELPDYGDSIAALVDGNSEDAPVALAYARALSNNLQYRALERLIDCLSTCEDIRPHFFQQLCSTFRANPARSERNHAQRRALLLRTANIFKMRLAQRYSSRFDVFLNSALAGIALDHEETVVHSYERLIGSFKEGEFSFSSSEFERWGALSRRVHHFFQIFEYLVRKGRFQLAETMLAEHFYQPETIKEDSQRAAMENAWITLRAAQADHMGVVHCYSTASETTQNDSRAIVRYAKALRALGEFQQARGLLERRLEQLNTPAKRAAMKQEIAKVTFSIDTSRLLSSYPQPRLPAGVIFLASQTCYNTMAMMAPALHELKKKGYAIINLMEGMVSHEPCGIDYIDRFAGTIPTTLYRHELTNSWEINWKARIVAASGINFYQGFYERLSTRARRYEVDINEDALYNDFRVQLKRADTCLKICQDIYRDVVRRGINVAFVSGNSHVTPFSIFRDFARAKDDPRLSFINCNVAYESYFSNLGSKFASTMCVTDMTLHRDRRAPFMALPHKFEAWYAANREDAELKRRAEEMIKVNRNSSPDDSTALKIIDWLTRERAKGKKIVCVFGKVPVDLNVPYDGGPGHSDMKDWLNDTVRIAGNAENLIVLVKPHPHELRPEIALDLINGFADLIEVPIPSNVHVLGHRDINVHALAPYLDLAILWNGSSSLELTALGVPVMMTSYFGKHDYPVDLIYPESREQYESYLKAGKFRIPSDELRNRAAFLISYLGTPDVSVLNEYSLRQITNDKVGIPRWRWEYVEDFMKNGDPRMELIADRMIEKFTGVSR